jgi:hypothetical protein
MRVTSGLPLAAAVVVSCFAAPDRSAAETWPAEAPRAGVQAAGPLYAYGPPYTYGPPSRYAPFERPRPGWSWRGYDTRNRDFYSRQWWPDRRSYRPSFPDHRYDSWWTPRWRQHTWRGYGPRSWDWRPY